VFPGEVPKPGWPVQLGLPVVGVVGDVAVASVLVSTLQFGSRCKAGRVDVFPCAS